MKSIAKALIVITCLVCACWMMLAGHTDFSIILVLFGGCVAILYEVQWK